MTSNTGHLTTIEKLRLFFFLMFNIMTHFLSLRVLESLFSTVPTGRHRWNRILRLCSKFRCQLGRKKKGKFCD